MSTPTITFEDEWCSLTGTSISIKCTKPRTLDVQQDRKTPLAICVLIGGTFKDNRNATLQSYCYGVPFRNKEVCLSDLVESNNDSMQDLLHKIARILVKKYNRPCYVQLANGLDNNSFSSGDQIQLLQKIVTSIDEHQ